MMIIGQILSFGFRE